MQIEHDLMQTTLPRDLTKLTDEQAAWCVAHHTALPLAEIRRRQELTDRQIGMAWKQRNDFALANLRVREEILRQAAERKLPPLQTAALTPHAPRCPTSFSTRPATKAAGRR